jgi:hypothetical protein
MKFIPAIDSFNNNCYVNLAFMENLQIQFFDKKHQIIGVSKLQQYNLGSHDSLIQAQNKLNEILGET